MHSFAPYLVNGQRLNTFFFISSSVNIEYASKWSGNCIITPASEPCTLVYIRCDVDAQRRRQVVAEEARGRRGPGVAH